VNFFSWAASFLTARRFTDYQHRTAVVWGLGRTAVVWGLLLASFAHAQSYRLEPRAGSNFSNASGDYGQTSRRPYRRQQKPARRLGKSLPEFDYRLEKDAAANVAMLDTYDESGETFERGAFNPASFDPWDNCDGSEDCCCGSCVEPGWGYEPGCGCDDTCEPDCGCDDSCRQRFGSCGDAAAGRWNVGFQWTFVKPHYSKNIALTTMTGDGANSSTFSDTQFDYDLELAPRAWIEANLPKNWSWRLSYWQFDQSPATASTSPNANGFGEITHPAFGDVDISTTIPTDTLSASSRLNVYTIDLEALKQANLDGWQLGVGGGVRYASAEQKYFAQLRDTGNVLLGQIDFSHQFEGFGPTLSVSARRPVTGQLKLVCAARGSLLFGDGSSRFSAGEDLDLANPFTTTRQTNREDLLPIGEVRVGLEWLSPKNRRSWQWLLSTAMEGQMWGNVGNASSETADLGFLGFQVGAGWLR